MLSHIWQVRTSDCVRSQEGEGADLGGKMQSKIWNAARICMSSLSRGRTNLCIVSVLVDELPERAREGGHLRRPKDILYPQFSEECLELNKDSLSG